jgi:hypothetical protein
MFLFQPLRPSRVLSSIAAVLLGALTPGLHAAGEIYDAVSSGTAITLVVASDGSPAPTFQWTKNGTVIPGATGARLTLPNVSNADAAVYNAIATNSAGWALSNDFILSISAAVSNTAPSFTVQPYPSVSAPAGSQLTLGATAIGTPAPGYQWFKNGNVLTGATNSTFTIASLTTSDSATYAVLAKNIAGSAMSNGSVVTVTNAAPVNSAPVFTTQPAPSVQAIAGSTISLSATATGSPAPGYQWFKNGAVISGATNSTLTLVGVTTNDAATYFVLAKNIAGPAMSNSSVVTVTNAAPVNSAPVFTTQPDSSVQAIVGSTISLSATATGTPAPGYQWFKNGTVISGATNPTLTLVGVTTNDAATYFVLAKNIAGSAPSNSSVVTVATPAPVNSAPVFTTQPAASVQAIAGSTISLSATATGSPAPGYQWFKNGTVISGATNSTLTLVGVTTNDAATYFVLAKSIAGAAPSNSSVVTVANPAAVNSAPVFTTQPAPSVQAIAGSTISPLRNRDRHASAWLSMVQKRRRTRRRNEHDSHPRRSLHQRRRDLLRPGQKHRRSRDEQ